MSTNSFLVRLVPSRQQTHMGSLTRSSPARTRGERETSPDTSLRTCHSPPLFQSLDDPVMLDVSLPSSLILRHSQFSLLSLYFFLSRRVSSVTEADTVIKEMLYMFSL